LTINGAKYEGEIRDGKANGKGTLIFPDRGRKYVGEFKDDKREGQGTWTISGYGNLFKYEGGWQNDAYHGQGTETYPRNPETDLTNRTYTGEFKDGYRWGQGTMTLPDGRKYEGSWKYNLFHGQGTLTDKDGKQQAGWWELGEYRGANAVVSEATPPIMAVSKDASGGTSPLTGGTTPQDTVVLVDERTVWRHLHLDGPSHLLLDDPAPYDANWKRAPEIVKSPSGPMARVYMKHLKNFNDIAGRSWPAEWPEELTSPAPSSDWVGVTYDDSLWLRACWPQPIPDMAQGPAEDYCQKFVKRSSPFDTVVVLARSRFEIKDPARVKACRLSLDYYGGVAVYVNGKELVRGHLPGQETNLVARLADPYPEQVLPRDSVEATAGCLRQLREVEIPVSMLRSGLNILAVEAHPAPIPYLTLKRYILSYTWPAIGVKQARLTVAPADVAVTNGMGLQGLRIWNCAVTDTVTASKDLREAGVPVEPVTIRAARNSVFSGRLMAGSDQALKGLTVTVSDLLSAAAETAKIPAAAVRVRYAVPATPDKSWVSKGRFDGLLDQIPAEIPAITVAREGKDTAAKALAPLWFTVRVPATAPAGRYEGRITIAAQGFPSQTVPLHVQVCDWVMPEVRDWSMQNFIYHAEEMEAMYYGVPLYSDRHFELVGKTLALLAELNSRQVMVNLVCDFFASGWGGSVKANPESLVRWIKQPDGSFKHDFTNFDRYLEMVDKTIGKPRTLRLNCWGEHGGRPAGLVSDEKGWFTKDFPGEKPVTVLDPATGQLSRMKQPPLGTEENYRFWKPVFDELLKKIKARGWLDETTLGYNAWYATSIPALVDVANRLWPGGEWSFTGHNGQSGMLFRGSDSNTVMTVRHADTVMNFPNPNSQPMPRRNTFAFNCRLFQRDDFPLNDQRNVAEKYALYNGYDGVGDFGANLFPLKKPVGGYYVHGAGSGTGWAVDPIYKTGASRSTLALLYPGADGPVATERFEMLREGLELCEAVIFVRNALAKKPSPLSPDLQQRAERYLRERETACSRVAFRARYLQAAEDARLLDLAGEVAREIEGKK